MRENQEPERVDLETQPPADDRVTALRELFPEAFADGEFNSEAIDEALGEPSAEVAERYGLSWAGRANAQRAVQRPSVATLRPDLDKSLDFYNSQHLIIEGDNLEVLRLLQRGYNDQVKLIYIDPPYNTGKDFIYPDNFHDGIGTYLRFSRQADSDGVHLTSNSESSGRFHSAWLSMMYPRLVLARNLMAHDGFIFVSIDDHEVHHLRVLMNEVLGEENFVGMITRSTGTPTGGGSDGLVNFVDYILVYSRSPGSSLNGLEFSEADAAI